MSIIGLCGSDTPACTTSSPQKLDGFGIVRGKRERIVFGSSRVWIGMLFVVFSFGSSITHVPCAASTAHTGPFALTRGFCFEVVISSCMYDVELPQSHMLITALRSTPVGRSGAGGSTPAAILSVQSAYIFSARGPRRRIMLSISEPRCPVFTRWSHASRLVLKFSAFMWSSRRVSWLPS